MFDVNDGQSLCSGGDVCIRSRNINAVRLSIGNRHKRAIDKFRSFWIGYVDNLQTFVIGDEYIAELDGDRLRILQLIYYTYNSQFAGWRWTSQTDSYSFQ